MFTTIILGLAFVPIMLFIIFYAKSSPWRKTLQGMTLMWQKVAMASLIAFFLAAPFIPEPWHDLVKDIILTVLMVLFWVMFTALRLAQTEERPVPKNHGQGFVPPEDVESTGRVRRTRKR